jgi:hypothetical protein
MMTDKRFFTILLFALFAIGSFAQGDDFGLWTSADFKKKLFPGFDATIGGEMRTRDDSKKFERWAATAGMDYEVMKHLKIDGGYVFIYKNVAGRTTSKGNYVSSFWSPRHRLYLSATGDIDFGRINLSLRERYQYTYRTSKSVSKYDSDGSQKDDEEITGKCYNILRTRPMIKYDIPHSNFKPYASFEAFNSLNRNGAIDKIRIKAGTIFKVNKHHAFDFFYVFQNHSDDDEPRGHAIGLGYTYKLK